MTIDSWLWHVARPTTQVLLTLQGVITLLVQTLSVCLHVCVFVCQFVCSFTIFHDLLPPQFTPGSSTMTSTRTSYSSPGPCSLLVLKVTVYSSSSTSGTPNLWTRPFPPLTWPTLVNCPVSFLGPTKGKGSFIEYRTVSVLIFSGRISDAGCRCL